MRHGWKHSAETEKLSPGKEAKTELGGDCNAYVSMLNMPCIVKVWAFVYLACEYITSILQLALGSAVLSQPFEL